MLTDKLFWYATLDFRLSEVPSFYFTAMPIPLNNDTFSAKRNSDFLKIISNTWNISSENIKNCLVCLQNSLPL